MKLVNKNHSTIAITLFVFFNLLNTDLNTKYIASSVIEIWLIKNYHEILSFICLFETFVASKITTCQT